MIIIIIKSVYRKLEKQLFNDNNDNNYKSKKFILSEGGKCVHNSLVKQPQRHNPNNYRVNGLNTQYNYCKKMIIVKRC